MEILVIRLQDLILDPARSIDTTSLPQEEAIALVRKFYGFLSPSTEVTIQEGIVVITFPEEKAQRAEEVPKTYAQVVRAGERGKYARAMPSAARIGSLDWLRRSRRRHPRAFWQLGRAAGDRCLLEARPRSAALSSHLGNGSGTRSAQSAASTVRSIFDET